MSSKIISPCISICKTEPITGYCYGCARTNEEKKIWKDEKTSDVWKKENLNLIKTRMKGWQLDTFHESYKNKRKKEYHYTEKITCKKKFKDLFS